MSYGIDFMERHGAVYLGEDEGGIRVAVAKDPSSELRRLLESYHCRRVRFVRIDGADLRVRLQRAAAGAGRAVRAGGQGVGIEGTREGAPAVNLVNSLLNEAARLGASDVHLQLGAEGVVVRYRIDGVLRQPEGPIAAESFRSLCTRVKVMAGLNSAERRRPQDGRFTARLAHDAFDVRVATMPTVDGESLVLRLFPGRRHEPRLGELGLPGPVLEHLRRAVRATCGFIILCGPTGSGKTTTLHAMLREIDRAERKIITIEDPVEYRLDSVEQIQTNAPAGLTFDSILRRVLRRDPDVIMIGEIRDEETAALAIRAALTGHLVLATVHARSETGVLERLVDLGVGAHLLDLLAPLVVSQRLVRTRCTCGTGCETCFHSGMRGRTGLFAMLAPGRSHYRLEADADHKVATGITTREEARCALTQ